MLPSAGGVVTGDVDPLDQPSEARQVAHQGLLDYRRHWKHDRLARPGKIGHHRIIRG
jgi:hypothetical protein